VGFVVMSHSEIQRGNLYIRVTGGGGRGEREGGGEGEHN
jgi:hypothetical protein